ncbi:MAG: cellulase family glycosylhydrolase [Cyclobacteriaceae bacterium]
MKTFLSTSGTQIVLDSTPIRLIGFCFGNEVWERHDPPATHHSEKDYEWLKNMGLNVVRFYIHHQTIETQAGWHWIDQNVEWARNHGIYLILNLHIAPGGFQSLGDGDGLWGSEENQNQFVSFWKRMAERYKDETQVAGYALLNEPVPSESVEQWVTLADRTAKEIRKVDQHHILFLERAFYAKAANLPNDNLNFPVIDDSNVVYEFHTYQPYEYTHQGFEWTGIVDGGNYPDEQRTEYVNDSNGFDNTSSIQYQRNKAYLRASIDQYIDWGNRHQVPVYMGEFGTSIFSYRDDKGGASWMKDVLDIADEHQLNFTCHAYHENEAYGLFFDGSQLPTEDNCNKAMRELFKRYQLL